MTKIELDNLRISKYQELKNNLEAVKEFFRHGDILIKQVNSTLEEIKTLIDKNIETSFSKDDFNDLLDLRNEVLFPIFQNASFAKAFEKYTNDTIKNTDPVLKTTVSYNKSNDELLNAIITDYSDNVITKITTINYSSGKIVSKVIIFGNTTSTLEYTNEILTKETIVTELENILEITKNIYENSALLSTEYIKYVNGLKV